MRDKDSDREGKSEPQIVLPVFPEQSTNAMEKPGVSPQPSPEPPDPSIGRPGGDIRGVLGDDRNGLTDEKRGTLSERLPSDVTGGEGETQPDDDPQGRQARDRLNRRRLVRILTPALTFAVPILVLVIGLVLLARCVGGWSSGVDAGSSSMGLGSADQSVTGQGQDGSLPRVSIDYDGLAELFGETSVSTDIRTAPPKDMPAFDDWYDNDDEYVEAMVEKANKYESETDWMATVDTDLCRVTWFVRDGNKWKACGGYCSVQGACATLNPDGSTSYIYGNQYWWGPRSCTAKGAFKVLEGRMEVANGTHWNMCMFPSNHLGSSHPEKGCECHRMHENYNVDPAGLPLSQRHQSHGCTRYRNEVAEWIYRNIEDRTTVICFDQINPEPEVADCNTPEGIAKTDFDGGDFATWKGYEHLMSSSYDRSAPCGRSKDPDSGKAGHISGTKGSRVATNGGTGHDLSQDRGNLTVAQRAVLDAAESTGTSGPGMCLAWVNNVFDNAGHGFERMWTAGDACRAYCHSTNRSDLKPGMIIAVESTVTSPGIGHIGIYIGNGEVRDNETVNGGGAVVTRQLDEWLELFSLAGTPRWGWAGNEDLS